MFEFYKRLPVTVRYVYVPLALAAVIVITIIVAVSLSSKKSSFGATTAQENTVVYFYMPTCPHCVDFAPVWSEIKAKISKMTQPIRVVEVDVTSKTLPDGVPEGVIPPPFVPAIVVNKVVYEGKRTAKAITDYVNAKTRPKRVKRFGLI